MRRLIAAIFASLLPMPLQADGQHPTLLFPPPLAPDLASLPRLAGTDPVARKINAALQNLDDRDMSARTGCLDDPDNSFAGGFDVTLNGPYFLSIVYWNSYYCGTAHPWNDQWVVLFNLKTGAAIDAVALLPNALRPPPEDDNLATWSEEKSVLGAKPLTDLYLSRLALDPRNDAAEINDIDCVEALTHHIHDFLIWPDAKAHALMLMPYGMAYIFTPCQNTVAVPVSLLLKLHASPRLILALAD